MVLIMNKPFETYLSFVENELGVKLLCWQKMVLRSIYDGHCPYISGMRGGKDIMYRSARLFKEEIERDTGRLPPRIYELDSYAEEVVMCDEDWKENTEFEKESV